MNSLELKEIILQGESSKVEFKRKFTTYEKIAKELCAFANTIGGILLIGIDDDGKIYGIDSEKADFDVIERACKFYIEPILNYEIEVVHLSGKDIIMINVEESRDKPHFVLSNPDDKKSLKTAYIRSGEQSISASREMTKVMKAFNPSAPPIKISIGDRERRLFTFLEMHKKITVQDFSNLVNISRRRAERLLVTLVKIGSLQIHSNSGSDYFTLRG